MVEMAGLWNVCQGKLLTSNETRPEERRMFQSTKLKEFGDLNTCKHGEAEFEVGQMIFSLALFQYFLLTPLFFTFGMVIYTFCQCLFEVFRSTF